jgi:glycosyltransferase involved in cell wall biosynthesis
MTSNRCASENASVSHSAAGAPADGPRLRILHVAEAYGAGVLTVVNQLANGMAREGHDVVLAHGLRPETPAGYATLLDPAVRRVVLPFARRIAPLTDLRALFALWRLLRQLQPDVVHLHSSKAGFLGRVAARLAGRANVFYSPHGFAFQDRSASPRKRALYRLLERCADRFSCAVLVACSEDEATIAREVAAQVVLMENAVDAEALARHAGKPGRRDASREVTVVGMGRADPVKRPELFEAVARLVQEHAGVPVRFLWVGGGPAAFSKQSPVGQTGWLARPEALQLVGSQADVLLQTSVSEGMPMSVLEAKAMGIPAVVTNVPGNRCAVTNGVTGFVREDRPHALAEAVVRLVRAPALRERMSQCARREAYERFAFSRRLPEWLALYRRNAADARQVSRPRIGEATRCDRAR